MNPLLHVDLMDPTKGTGAGQSMLCESLAYSMSIRGVHVPGSRVTLAQCPTLVRVSLLWDGLKFISRPDSYKVSHMHLSLCWLEVISIRVIYKYWQWARFVPNIIGHTPVGLITKIDMFNKYELSLTCHIYIRRPTNQGLVLQWPLLNRPRYLNHKIKTQRRN